MKRLKVMTILGTRPEIIRLSRVMALLDEFCEHVMVHTGQNFDYELNEVFFSELEVRRPDHFLDAAAPTPAGTIANVIARIDPLLEQVAPDAVLILGDTNSSLAAMAAKRRKIPIFHMEAGNRSFDQRVPEEINRKIVDHIADVNMTYSALAREALLREGLRPDFVVRTGSPMREVLDHYRGGIAASGVLARLGLRAGEFFTVSAHREENVDSPAKLRALAAVLDMVGERYGHPVIVSTHPRTRARIDALGLAFGRHTQLLRPLGFFDYIQLQQSARAVLSDSGTITEESSILNFPAINLRDSHERPEGMEEGSVMLTGLNGERILQALDILAKQARGPQRQIALVRDYEADNVSGKVLRILHSFVDKVNHEVWHKPPADGVAGAL